MTHTQLVWFLIIFGIPGLLAIGLAIGYEIRDFLAKRKAK